MARTNIKLRRLLRRRTGRKMKLRAHRQHTKQQCQKRGIRLRLLRRTQSPESAVIGVEGLSVDVRVHGVYGLEIPAEQDVGLDFLGEDRDHFGESTLTRPVVGEGVLGADAEDVGGRLRHVVVAVGGVGGLLGWYLGAVDY